MTATLEPLETGLVLRRPPRFATRPDLRLRHRGKQVAAIAAALGRPLLP